jgi:Fe-S-cluster containining protein
MSSYCLECSKLGQDCCRESHAKFLTLGDAARIADFLNDEIKSFALYGELNYKDKEEYIYIHKHQSYYYDLTLEDNRLLQLKEKKDGSCFFQEDDGRCRIYPARPLICRTYPFWLLDDREVIFDGCSADCRIVCAITGNDDFEDVTKLEDKGGTGRSKALEYIGHTRSSIKELLGQMMSEIKDYRMNIHTFVRENRINIP